MRFVDELERPYHGHRRRRLSRYSSKEEIVVSTPSSRGYSHGRRPVYYDGPADAQSDDLRRTTLKEEEGDVSVNSRGKESRSKESLEVSQMSKPSRNTHPTSITSDSHATRNMIKSAPILLAKSSSRPFSAMLHSFPTLDGLYERPNGRSDATDTCRLNNRGLVASEDYGYEVDSQFPSPPLVHFAVPVHQRSQSLSPLRLPPRPRSRMPAQRDLCSNRAAEYKPEYVSDGPSTAVSGPGSSGIVLDSAASFDARESAWYPDTPPTSVTSSEHKTATLEVPSTTAEDPEHPDHLAYLLSTTHIAPCPDHGNNAGTKQHSAENLSSESSSTIWHPNRDRSYSDYDNASINTINLDGGTEEPRAPPHTHPIHGEGRLWTRKDNDSDENIARPQRSRGPKNGSGIYLSDIFDEAKLEQKFYDTGIDYEAEGKAYMESVRRQRQQMQMEGHETARAVY